MSTVARAVPTREEIGAMTDEVIVAEWEPCMRGLSPEERVRYCAEWRRNALHVLDNPCPEWCELGPVIHLREGNEVVCHMGMDRKVTLPAGRMHEMTDGSIEPDDFRGYVQRSVGETARICLSNFEELIGYVTPTVAREIAEMLQQLATECEEAGR
jgi:hypothetical protein